MSDINFSIAVKAFIINNGKLLLIKRWGSDEHKPLKWDIPGGRIEMGEDPVEGVKRETSEETNLVIEPIMPIDVHHFIRDDGQKITMIIFLAKWVSGQLQLSEEHTDYQWVDPHDPLLPNWLKPTMTNYLGYIKF